MLNALQLPVAVIVKASYYSMAKASMNTQFYTFHHRFSRVTCMLSIAFGGSRCYIVVAVGVGVVFVAVVVRHIFRGIQQSPLVYLLYLF